MSDGKPLERLFPSMREPRIAFTWLMRLRWFAVVGQVAATIAAHALSLNAPIFPVAIGASITVLSNLLLIQWSRRNLIRTWMLLAVLLLDMTVLTFLLVYTGGHKNPFSTLYLVHVAMAVTTLGGGWTWLVVLAASLGYFALFVLPEPASGLNDIPLPYRRVGLVFNLALTGGLIAYFVGRVNRSLRRHEEEISDLRERNARHEKLATLTTLAAGAAHELGTPLATIAVVAKELELAIAKLPDRADLVEDTQLIRQECNRCRFILDRMRVEVASDNRGIVTPLSDLLTLLDQHLRDNEKTRLQRSGLTDGVSIAASCPAIEQSLTVMIRNAIDASPAGAVVQMQIRRDGESIVFDVIDQGHGMSPDVLKRAGDPFFTTKEPGRGMGLGLFLVRLVAENFSGSFSLASTPGKGTTSTLRLPIATR